MALGHFGLIVASLWGDFGVCGAHWAYGGAIRSPWATLGLLWLHFGSVVGSFLGYEGCFGVLWGHSELTLSLPLAYKKDFGVLMMSSRVYEGQFSEITHFPNGF